MGYQCNNSVSKKAKGELFCFGEQWMPTVQMEAEKKWKSGTGQQKRTKTATWENMACGQTGLESGTHLHLVFLHSLFRSIISFFPHALFWMGDTLQIQLCLLRCTRYMISEKDVFLCVCVCHSHFYNTTLNNHSRTQQIAQETTTPAIDYYLSAPWQPQFPVLYC